MSETHTLKPGEHGITNGTVKNPKTDKGFKFFLSPDIPIDVFVHASVYRNNHLMDGDRVTFAYKRIEDGRYRATRIISVEGDK